MIRVLLLLFLLAWPDPLVQVFVATGEPRELVVVRVYHDRVVIVRVEGGEGPDGWGEELFKVMGTSVWLYTYRSLLPIGISLMVNPADLDLDGDVDVNDFGLFMREFTGPGGG
jgi:hypothetical protein